eukprot:TRINITY_DN537_c0_g1_i5.p1 TRINITY_DN537_c0_g1~~TRINITY_DN537_c0_g1_i5.p1  ORF type:complete len:108 (-),score=0.18 TRINITY_DN537_c0_g1_i5:627-950(-)
MFLLAASCIALFSHSVGVSMFVGYILKCIFYRCSCAPAESAFRLPASPGAFILSVFSTIWSSSWGCGIRPEDILDQSGIPSSAISKAPVEMSCVSRALDRKNTMRAE